MGHLLSTKSSLVPLIDRLNRYPIGLVDSATLREILSLLFTEREAFVASRFPLHEATLGELAELTALPETELQPALESMADKGLVMDMPYAGTTYFLLMPGLIGFMEFTFMRRRSDLPLKRLARLMTDYLHERGPRGQAAEFFGSATPLTRALVYEDRIPVESRVTSYEDARQIIADTDFCAVTTCYCRHKKEHLGQACRKAAPVDGICMVLGEGARFLVRRGFARESTREEMLTKLDDRQRPRPPLLRLQLLSLLLRAHGRRADGLRGRDREDTLSRGDRPRTLRLLRRMPQDLQRQVHRAGRRLPFGPARGATRRSRPGDLPRLRRLSGELRAARHLAGAAPARGRAAARQGHAVHAHPLGERSADAVRGRPSEVTLAHPVRTPKRWALSPASHRAADEGPFRCCARRAKEERGAPGSRPSAEWGKYRS